MDINWKQRWPEVFSLLFLVAGFMIAVVLRSPVLSYATIILSGFVAGRILYTKRFKEPILPFVLIIVGFLVGYLIGSFWVSRMLSLLLFIIFFILSYQLHLKGIITTFKSEIFIK